MRSASARRVIACVLLAGACARARPTIPPFSLQARVVNALLDATSAARDGVAHGLSPDRSHDWLVLASTGTCLNHDLRFGACGDASGWTVNPQRVSLGVDCLSIGGVLGGALALVPCESAAATNALGARMGRLCAGEACTRCATARAPAASARLDDGCASVLVMRAPRRWAALVGAMLAAMYLCAACALLCVSDSRGGEVPTVEACALARETLAALRAEPQTAAADAAIRAHAFGLRAKAGYVRLESFQLFVREQLLVERALGAAARALAARAPPRSEARALFAGRAAEEADALRQLTALGAALGLDPSQLRSSHEPLAATRALASHLEALGTAAPPAIAAAALALSHGAHGALCGLLSASLALHYALPHDALAYLDAAVERAAPARTAAAVARDGARASAFETACVAALAAGLRAGVPRQAAERAARLLQGHELAYWHAVYAACAPLDEPLLRGTEGRVALSDGASLHYTDAGPRGGRVLLLLHGWPDSLHSWRLLTPLFHPELRVVAVSLRGFGESTLPPAAAAADGAKSATAAVATTTTAAGGFFRFGGSRKQDGAAHAADTPLSVASFAADVRVLLARLKVSRVSIVGYSLGALVARAVAAGVGAPADGAGADVPSRANGASSADSAGLTVDNLFIMSSSPTGAKNHVAQKLLPLFRDSTLTIDEPFVRVWQARVLHAPAALPDWFRKVLQAESLKLPKALWLAGLEAMAADDHLAALRAVRARTRILLGAEDRLNPRVDAEQLLNAMHDCSIHMIPEAGCVPHWDAPEAVAHEINCALVPAAGERG